MCIIIAKNKSDRLPTYEELLNSFEYNSDGAGFMYTQRGKVVIDKGYMKFSDFIKRYNQLCKEFHDFKNKSLVIHCRIGTSSGNTPANTHPYPITNKEKELHKLKFETDLGMAHNGIIRDYTPTWTKPTTNDTQEFILKYVYNLYNHWNDFYKNRFILEGLSAITNSKLAFLDKDDNLYLVGYFVEDNGLNFSNTSYKSYRSSTYNYGYSSVHKTDKGVYEYTEKISSPYSEEDKYLTLPSEDEFDDRDSFYLDSDYDYLKDYYANREDDDYDRYTEEDDAYYETKEYLARDWSFEVDGIRYCVGKRDLVWDYYTGELFRMSDNNTLIKLFDNVRVFDEKNEEVFI
jgi:predicted glutamine amidotransferase